MSPYSLSTKHYYIMYWRGVTICTLCVLPWSHWARAGYKLNIYDTSECRSAAECPPISGPVDSSSNSITAQVLTNGSFVSLKDIPSGCSEEGSARLTASTGTDDSGSSDTSSGSGLASAGDYNNIGQSDIITILSLFTP